VRPGASVTEVTGLFDLSGRYSLGHTGITR